MLKSLRVRHSISTSFNSRSFVSSFPLYSSTNTTTTNVPKQRTLSILSKIQKNYISKFFIDQRNLAIKKLRKEFMKSGELANEFWDDSTCWNFATRESRKQLVQKFGGTTRVFEEDLERGLCQAYLRVAQEFNKASLSNSRFDESKKYTASQLRSAIQEKLDRWKQFNATPFVVVNDISLKSIKLKPIPRISEQANIEMELQVLFNAEEMVIMGHKWDKGNQDTNLTQEEADELIDELTKPISLDELRASKVEAEEKRKPKRVGLDEDQNRMLNNPEIRKELDELESLIVITSASIVSPPPSSSSSSSPSSPSSPSSSSASFRIPKFLPMYHPLGIVKTSHVWSFLANVSPQYILENMFDLPDRILLEHHWVVSAINGFPFQNNDDKLLFDMNTNSIL